MLMVTVCLQKHLNSANIGFFCFFFLLHLSIKYYFITLTKKQKETLLATLELQRPKAFNFTTLTSLFTARPSHPSHLSVCGGHVFGRRGPPGPPGVPANVPQPAPAQHTGGPHHVWTHGSGSWAQLWRGCQELRVQGHQRPELQTDPGERGLDVVLGWSMMQMKRLGVNVGAWIFKHTIFEMVLLEPSYLILCKLAGIDTSAVCSSSVFFLLCVCLRKCWV